MRRLYVMVSIPEAKVENVFDSPIILGVFDSKETAQNAWKARTPEFRDIKAKTVHKYVEMFLSDRTDLPQYIYLWATYYVYGFSEGEKPNFIFFPYNAGYYETYEEYLEKKNWVMSHNPISHKQSCDNCGWIFYASNEDIIEKIEINRLVRIPVKLTEKTSKCSSINCIHET